MRKIISLIFMVLFLFSLALAEETTEMYVTASQLNGRANPSRKASVEARFDRGDSIEAIDWSKDHHWIEVTGGETGTVWVWWEYVTERIDTFTVRNNFGSKVKIRKEPYGTVTGYLKNNKTLVIDRVIFGWGHSKRGWIDLKYVTEEETNE